MSQEAHHLEIPSNNREAFVLCLTLGTLEAMRRDDWPLEAGIWTLGRPVFWQPLTELPAELAQILQTVDELSAIADLGDRSTAEKELNRMIALVRSRLSTLPEKSWQARWIEE